MAENGINYWHGSCRAHAEKYVIMHTIAHICHSKEKEFVIFRLTPASRPNTVGLKCPSVRPSTKSFFNFNEIWYVGRGRRVMHDGMQYDPIQGEGHKPLKVGNSAIFKGYLLPIGAGK